MEQKLDIEFFMKRFSNDFPVNKINMEVLLSFARDMGATVDLWENDFKKKIAEIEEELRNKIPQIEKLKLQLEKLQKEEYDLSTRKERIEKFFNDMRVAGLLENFEEDPF